MRLTIRAEATMSRGTAMPRTVFQPEPFRHGILDQEAGAQKEQKETEGYLAQAVVVKTPDDPFFRSSPCRSCPTLLV